MACDRRVVGLGVQVLVMTTNTLLIYAYHPSDVLRVAYAAPAGASRSAASLVACGGGWELGAGPEIDELGKEVGLQVLHRRPEQSGQVNHHVSPGQC